MRDDVTENPEESDEAEKNKKKSGGEEGEGSAAQSLNVSEQAIASMYACGFSKELILEVMANWRHITGQGIINYVADFMKKLVKSNHVKVDIEKGSNFSVVHDFIQEGKRIQKTVPSPAAKHAPHVNPTLGPQ